MDEYFWQDSRFLYVGNDRYDGEIIITGSPVDHSITLNINDSCFDLVGKDQLDAFIAVLKELQANIGLDN